MGPDDKQALVNHAFRGRSREDEQFARKLEADIEQAAGVRFPKALHDAGPLT